jgi:hypothetical protein
LIRRLPDSVTGDRGVRQTFNLIGDPAMPMKSASNATSPPRAPVKKSQWSITTGEHCTEENQNDPTGGFCTSESHNQRRNATGSNWPR